MNEGGKEIEMLAWEPLVRPSHSGLIDWFVGGNVHPKCSPHTNRHSTGRGGACLLGGRDGKSSHLTGHQHRVDGWLCAVGICMFTHTSYSLI